MKILSGHFENARQGFGYNLDFETHSTNWAGMQTPIYRCWLDADHPLQFRMKDGTVLRTTDGFPTDGGSVKPIAAQLWIPKDRFIGFLFHDDIYQHGGCWRKRPGCDWEWVRLSRAQADELLRMMCRCDPVPCGAWKSGLVWAGVRIGGWVAWDGKQPHGPPPERPAKPDADDGEVIGI